MYSRLLILLRVDWVGLGLIHLPTSVLIEVIDLWLLSLHLPVLFLGLPLLLVPAGIFFLLSQPVPVFLFLPVLFKLGVPGSNFEVVYTGPSVIHVLCSLFQSEWVVPHVGLDHGLPAEVPFSMFEIGTYCPGWALNDAQHLLSE